MSPEESRPTDAATGTGPARGEPAEKAPKKTAKEGRPRRSRRRRLARFFTVVALLGIGALVATWIWIESSAGQERLRRWLEERGGAALGRSVSIGAFELDLVPFQATLGELQISGEPGADAPLLRAESVRIRLGARALLSRELIIRSLEIVRPAVHWDIAGEGETSARPLGGAAGFTVAIDQLHLVEGSVEINHQRLDLDVSLADFSIEMQPTGLPGVSRSRAGTLRIGNGSLRIPTDEPAEAAAPPRVLEPIFADLAFTLEEGVFRVENLRVGLATSNLAAVGELRQWRTGRLDLSGRIAVADIARMVRLPGAREHEGEVELSGAVTLGPDGLRMLGGLTADSVVFAGVPATDLTARVEATTEQVAVRDIAARLFEGSIDARLEVNLEARPRIWSLDYEVAGVNLARLTTSPAFSGFRFAGIGAIGGSLSWQRPWNETVNGTGNIELILPPGTLAASPPSPAAEESTASEAGADAGDQAGERVGAPGGQGLAAPTPSLPLPVSARASYDLDAGTLIVRDGSASLPSTRASLEGSVDLDGNLAAEFRVDSGDLRIVDRFFTQVRRFRGEQPAPRPLGLAGDGEIAVSIGGTVDAPSVDGTLLATALSVSGDPVGDVQGRLRLAGASLEIVDLQLRRADGTGSGEGRFRIGPRSSTATDYSLRLRLDDYPMQVSLPRLGIPLTVGGDATGELALTGDYGSAPQGQLEIRGTDVRLNDLRNLTADVLVRLEPDEWIADRFVLLGPRGRLAASGTWQRDDNTVRARLDGFNIDASIAADLTATEVPIAGTLELQAQLTGDWTEPDAAATLRWQNVEAFGVSIGSVGASAELRGGSIAVAAVGRPGPAAPAVPPATPTAMGGAIPVPLPQVPADGWAATFSADLAAPRIASVRAAGESSLVLAVLAAQGYELGEEIEVRGRLVADGSGPLGDWLAWEVSADLSGFELTSPGLEFSIPEPLNVSLQQGVLRAELPRLISDAGTLDAAATIDLQTRRWLEARADGSLDLEVLRVFTNELEVGGQVDMSLEATGNIASGEIDGEFILYQVDLRRPDWPYAAEGISGAVRLTNGRLELVDITGTTSGQPFHAEGAFPVAALFGDEAVDPVRLEVSVDELPVEPLARRSRVMRELVSGGSSAVTLSVSGRGIDWRTYVGSLAIRELDVAVADLQLRMAEPTTFAIDSGRLTLESPIVLRGPATDLTVGGGFELGPFQLDITLQGRAPLDPLSAVIPDWGLAGRANLDVQIAGDPPDMRFRGTVGISSALINAPVLQPVERIEADLTLQDRLVRIESFSGYLGASSFSGEPNIAGDGELQLVDGVPQRFLLNARTVGQAQLRLAPNISVTLEADLVLEGTLDSSLLSGSVTVSEADYTKRWESEQELLELTLDTTPGVDSPLARSVNLDLTVRAANAVRIKNNLADVELSADLEVLGTLESPVLVGSATVLDGVLTLRNHRYRILQGTVEFQNPVRTEPNFDFRAETSIRRFVVTIGVSGSPQRDLQFTYSSSPPVSDLDLIRLLAVGDTPNRSRRAVEDTRETLGTLGAQASSFLTQQYLGEVERGAARVFGVDRFRVEPAVVAGSGDPTARVTIGKQVTPDLWISWTSVLGTTEEQLVTLEYQLTRGIRVTATREEDGSLALDFRFDHRIR